MRLAIPYDYEGSAYIEVDGEPVDRVRSITAGPDGVTCYLEGETGFYEGTAQRGKLRLVRLGDA